VKSSRRRDVAFNAAPEPEQRSQLSGRLPVALLGSLQQPLDRLAFILLRAIAVEVTKRKVELGNSETLSSGYTEPPHRRACVRCDAHAVQEHAAQVVGCVGIALFRRKAIPLQGFSEVLRGEFVTNPVDVTELGLSMGVTAVSRIDQGSPKVKRFGIIWGQANHDHRHSLRMTPRFSSFFSVARKQGQSTTAGAIRTTSTWDRLDGGTSSTAIKCSDWL
jgi:hypothetical protein